MKIKEKKTQQQYNIALALAPAPKTPHNGIEPKPISFWTALALAPLNQTDGLA